MESSKYLTLGKLIKKERKKQNFTQEDLSSKVGIDEKTLGRIERRENPPSFTSFCKIIEILKVEPNYLLDGIIPFSKQDENPIDVELRGNIKTLSNEAKISLNEFIKNSRITN